MAERRDLPPPDPSRRQFERLKQRVTLLGGGINLLLAAVKIAFGYLARSQALLVDGIHSLSDLLSDLFVYLTLRLAGREADESHPYGHARFETAATILVGLLLVGVAAGLLVDLADRLEGTRPLWRPEPTAAAVALLSVLAKEGLYRWTLKVAEKTRSPLLAANAWHHRSDAISSAVVLLGLFGVFSGYQIADAAAAIVVSLMIGKMGVGFIWQSLKELVDTALPRERVQEIARAILEVEGVKGLHLLRTRQMAGQTLIEVHIEVEPRISVSEGHAIADRVRDALRNRFGEVAEVTVHTDAEPDLDRSPAAGLPPRKRVIAELKRCWQHLPYIDQIEQILLHYLEGAIDVELFLPISLLKQIPPEEIAQELRTSLKPLKYIRSLKVHFTVPQTTLHQTDEESDDARRDSEVH